MCEHTRLSAFYNSNAGKYDFLDLFSGLDSCINESDYSVVNLETPVAGEALGFSNKNFSFNTPKEFAEALYRSGVNMVTTANNHVLDRGVQGAKNTIDALDAIGLDHTGSFRSREEAHPLLKEIGGLKIAFLSYTYGTEACYNHCYLEKGQEYLVNLIRNQELKNPIKRYFLLNSAIPAKAFRLAYRTLSPANARKDVSDRKEKDKKQKCHILEDIRFCRSNGADYIICCLHCGGQFNQKPTAYTKDVVKFFRANGVDFVVGNHEHCIHPYSGDENAVYSLGNLSSNYGIDRPPYDRLAEYSVVFHLYLDMQGEKKEIIPAFSIVKSVKRRDGKIVTMPVERLYHMADETEKQRLFEELKKCVSLFLNDEPKTLSVEKEYFIRDFIQ